MRGRDHPDEACGVIAGPGGLRPARTAHPDAQRRALADVLPVRLRRTIEGVAGAGKRGRRAVVIYHSHTATEAYPSRTDISYAAEPDAHYVLVSTRDPDRHELRSYRIVDGVVTEEPVDIVASSH